MDYFSWAPYFDAFWTLPLLCLLFMAVMMIGCGGMMFRSCHGSRNGDGRETARQISDRDTGNR